MTKLLSVVPAVALLFSTSAVLDAQQRAPELYEAASKGDGSALLDLRTLAQSGDPVAQLNIGYMYDKGEGVPKDSVQAVAWYRKSAEHGNALAASNLALMYRDGEGAVKDAVIAAGWFRRAAEQGDSLAQFDLGLMYVKGEGVPRDSVYALNWMRRAAEQGVAQAQLFMGLEYSKADDYVKAHMWADLAAIQNVEGAKKFRTELEAAMTPEQIEEAQKLSSEWKPQSADASLKAMEDHVLTVPAQSSIGEPNTYQQPRFCSAAENFFQNGNEVKQIACLPNLMFIIPTNPIQPGAYWIGVRNLSREVVDIDPAQWRLEWSSKNGIRHVERAVGPNSSGAATLGRPLMHSTVFPNGTAEGVVYFGRSKFDFAVLVLSYRSKSTGDVTVRMDISTRPVFKR